MTVYIKFLGPIVVLVVALINVALLSKWQNLHDGRTVAHRTVLAGLISLMIIGTIITCAIVWKDDSTSATLALEVRLKTQRIIDLSETNAGLSKRIIDLAETNAVLGVRLADLANRTSAFLSGGNNYCYFDLAEDYEPSNHISWFIIHTGPETYIPVYHVRGTIQDCSKSLELKRTNPQMTDQEIREASTESFDLNDVDPKDWRKFRREDMGKRTFQTYVIDFYARNGHWEQTVTLARPNGKKWLIASKVRQVGIGVLSMASPYASMSDGFPTDMLPQNW